jgi:positive regulator of sigma E activity
MKTKLLPFIFLFLLTLPAFFFLLKPGIYWNMHDDMQIIRQLEMEKCLQDGQIPCRWVPDLGYSYGYPLFNFYPPMPYLVGQTFRLLDFSFVSAVKLTAASQIIFSALGMYLLAASLFGPIGGIISSLFYTYAPYHAVNIYVRGAMNEAWAAVFFPFILYFSKKLIETGKLKHAVLLSLSFCGLALSHNPMTLIFTPVLLVWSFFWLIVNYKKDIQKAISTTIKLAISGLLAFGLSAFFTLPVIFESKLVQIESMFTNYYHFSVHFASLPQLFLSRYWGDGPSVWGTEDKMSFAIGHLHWIIPLVACLYIAIKFLKTRRLGSTDLVAILISLLGLFSAFMSHERSTFIWLLFTTIQKIQFPWRFLNLTVFLFSLSAGFLSLMFGKKKLLSLLIILPLLILNLSYFTPVTSGPITDEQKLSGLAWRNQITSGIYDYLPKTARIAALREAKPYLDEIIPADTQYELSGQKKGTDWQFFNLSLSKPATIYLSQLYFPNFQVNNNGQPIEFQVEPELGRISLDLDAGNHQIYVKLHDTPIRYVANSISLSAIFLIGVLFIFPKIWKKLK